MSTAYMERTGAYMDECTEYDAKVRDEIARHEEETDAEWASLTRGEQPSDLTYLEFTEEDETALCVAVAKMRKKDDLASFYGQQIVNVVTKAVERRVEVTAELASQKPRVREDCFDADDWDARR